MLLSALFAALAAVRVVTAQQSSDTPKPSFFAYPLIGFESTTGPIVTGSPGDPAANATATALPYSNTYMSRLPFNATATPIASPTGDAPLNGTNGTTIPTTSYALGGIPTTIIQNITSTSTSLSTTMSCSTSMGFEHRSSIPTSYGFTTTTTTISITSTTHSTTTITPAASTFAGEVTTTVFVTETETTTEPPYTRPTPRGFNPLFAFAPAGPTANSRIKRFNFQPDAFEFSLPKRDGTLPNNSGGLQVERNGTTHNIYRRFPRELHCSVQITASKWVYVAERGAVRTAYVDGDMDVGEATTSVRTVEVRSTRTVTEWGERETVYAGCGGNNVVNALEGTTGDMLIFDRIIYRPNEGVPEANEMIVQLEDPTKCCMKCHDTPFCAGSIFAPSTGRCHIRLTQAPSNSTLPSNSTNPLPSSSNSTSFPSNSTLPFPPSSNSTSSNSTLPTCPGSRGFYLGTCQGQADFPLAFALWMSNGPCGRMSVWPVPVNGSLDTRLEGVPGFIN